MLRTRFLRRSQETSIPAWPKAQRVQSTLSQSGRFLAELQSPDLSEVPPIRTMMVRVLRTQDMSVVGVWEWPQSDRQCGRVICRVYFNRSETMIMVVSSEDWKRFHLLHLSGEHRVYITLKPVEFGPLIVHFTETMIVSLGPDWSYFDRINISVNPETKQISELDRRKIAMRTDEEIPDYWSVNGDWVITVEENKTDYKAELRRSENPSIVFATLRGIIPCKGFVIECFQVSDNQKRMLISIHPECEMGHLIDVWDIQDPRNPKLTEQIILEYQRSLFPRFFSDNVLFYIKPERIGEPSKLCFRDLVTKQTLDLSVGKEEIIFETRNIGKDDSELICQTSKGISIFTDKPDAIAVRMILDGWCHGCLTKLMPSVLIQLIYRWI